VIGIGTDAAEAAGRLQLPADHPLHYIGGRWVRSAGGGVIDVVDPAREVRIGSVAAGTAEDADEAVRAAAAAFGEWSSTPVAQRAAIIAALADGVADRAEELAGLITSEVGSPIGFSRSQQVGLPIDVARGIAGLLPGLPWEEQLGSALVVREPIGVVAAITPWNYPLHQAVAKVAAALGAGCTVVLKPSELAPFSAFALAEVLAEAGVPPGVFNLVTGYGSEVGEALARHPGVAMVSLTGSVKAGRRVMELAAWTVKQVALELGGKSATLVLDDADLEAVVPGAVLHAFRNAGQNCSALSRLVVPRIALPRVEEIARSLAGTFVTGDPTDESTQMGPLVTAEARARVLGLVEDGQREGARLIAGGADPPQPVGFFVRPTVFSDVTSDMRLAQEEIFGPVLAILAHDGDDDAVRIANDSSYGLSGAVWSAHPERAASVARRIRTGRVVVNGGAFNAAAPFGGYKLSGVGRELGRYGVEEYLLLKTLQL
jgi:acyl-CoA reductase-like NAD-dependent aldehyde dehydrogenase